MLARINREVANLGPALINLRHVKSFTAWADQEQKRNPMPFAADDREHSGRLNTIAGQTAPDTPGKKEGRLLVGFFRDARDQEYFMVVNMNYDRIKHSEHPWLVQRVRLGFTGDVQAVERLSRTTGKVERLELDGHELVFDLPGATGDLFKFATGEPFTGVEPRDGGTR